MSANTSPIFPATPYINTANLTAVTACATRAPIPAASLAANNLVLLSDVSANGRRVDKIQVQGASSSVTAATTAGLVGIWDFDGTTAYLIQEIPVAAQTPSATTPAFNASLNLDNLVLPAGHKLYTSTSVTTTANTNALDVTVFAGDY